MINKIAAGLIAVLGISLIAMQIFTMHMSRAGVQAYWGGKDGKTPMSDISQYLLFVFTISFFVLVLRNIGKWETAALFVAVVISWLVDKKGS